MAEKKAYRLKRLTEWHSEAWLYRLEPPMEVAGYDYVNDDSDKFVAITHIYEYVIVSAVVADYTGPETYIFHADSDGKALDMLELDGSYRGGLDHAQALANAGYSVIGEAKS